METNINEKIDSIQQTIIDDINYKLQYNSLSCNDLSELTKAFNLITQNIKKPIYE